MRHFLFRRSRPIVFVAVLSVACGAVATPDAQEQPAVTLTEADDTRTVTLSAGSELVLKLSVQLGTGYGWEVSELDDTKLVAVGKATVEKTTDDTVGQRERQVFRFRATGGGQTTLKLRYVRPWEKATKPSKSYSVRVTVTQE